MSGIVLYAGAREPPPIRLVLIPKETLHHPEDLGAHRSFALRGTGLLTLAPSDDEPPVQAFGVVAEAADAGVRFHVMAWTPDPAVDDGAGLLRDRAASETCRRIDAGAYAEDGVFFVRLEE